MIILFVLSLGICLTALYTFWRTFSSALGVGWTLAAVLLLIVPCKAFLVAPLNLFCAVVLGCMVWQFVLMYRLWASQGAVGSAPRFLAAVFTLHLIAAAAETNVCLFLAMSSVCFAWFWVRPATGLRGIGRAVDRHRSLQ